MQQIFSYPVQARFKKIAIQYIPVAIQYSTMIKLV